jgi:hypothetical protein
MLSGSNTQPLWEKKKTGKKKKKKEPSKQEKKDEEKKRTKERRKKREKREKGQACSLVIPLDFPRPLRRGSTTAENYPQDLIILSSPTLLRLSWGDKRNGMMVLVRNVQLDGIQAPPRMSVWELLSHGSRDVLHVPPGLLLRLGKSTGGGRVRYFTLLE